MHLRRREEGEEKVNKEAKRSGGCKRCREVKTAELNAWMEGPSRSGDRPKNEGTTVPKGR